MNMSSPGPNSSGIGKNYQFLTRAFIFRKPVSDCVRRCIEAVHTPSDTAKVDRQAPIIPARIINNLIFLFRILKSYRVAARNSDFYLDVANDLGNWSADAVFEAQSYFVDARHLFLRRDGTGSNGPKVEPVSRKLRLLASLVDGWSAFDPKALRSDPINPALWDQVRQDWKIIYLTDPDALLVDSDEFVRQQMASQCRESPMSEPGLLKLESDDGEEEANLLDAPGQEYSKTTPVSGQEKPSDSVLPPQPVYKAKRTASGLDSMRQKPSATQPRPGPLQISNPAKQPQPSATVSPLNTHSNVKPAPTTTREVIVTQPYAEETKAAPGTNEANSRWGELTEKAANAIKTSSAKRKSKGSLDENRIVKKPKEGLAEAPVIRRASKDVSSSTTNQGTGPQTPQNMPQMHLVNQVQMTTPSTETGTPRTESRKRASSFKAPVPLTTDSPGPEYPSPIFTLASPNGPVHFQSHSMDAPKAKNDKRKSGLIANMLESKNKAETSHQRGRSQGQSLCENESQITQIQTQSQDTAASESQHCATSNPAEERTVSDEATRTRVAEDVIASPVPRTPNTAKTIKEDKTNTALLLLSKFDLDGPGRPTGPVTIHRSTVSLGGMERRHTKTLATLSSIRELVDGCLRQLEPLTRWDTCDVEFARSLASIKMQLWSLKYAADDTLEKVSAQRPEDNSREAK